MHDRDSDILRRIEGTDSPVFAWAVDYPDGFEVGRHRHRRAQLIHSVSGAMTICTDQGAWVVPSTRGVWVPAGVEHWITMAGAVRMRTLFIAPERAAHLPGRCMVVAVSALLRELILAALDIDSHAPSGRDVQVLELAIEEIRLLKVQPLHLPMPTEARIARICRALMADPADQRTLAEWSAWAGMSERTAARAFLSSTGMGFGRWRQQLRLIVALSRLAKGEPILNIALDMGYDSPSAFSCMFRKALGAPPSDYFA
jgi:AraC-like DNA-binding protein/quercetin dioxygenase-like cupin family protein